MSWYSRHVFPYLCDWALGGWEVSRQRRRALASASGQVLEIGFGSGLNLPHYPRTVHRLTVIEPNPTMHRLARRRMKLAPFPVEAHPFDGQSLPWSDHAFDCTVTTFTLCSIPNAGRALAELWRVLRPGGRLLVLEHGLASDPRVQHWQRRLNRLQMWLGDGCRLDRDIGGLLRSLPWQDLSLETLYLPRVPPTHGFLYRGLAIKK